MSETNEPSNTPSNIAGEIDILKDLLTRKQQNYGESVFQPPFLAPNLSVYDGIMTRLSDKFSRLRTLNSGVPDVVNESVEDTIRDIAGYCILTLIELKRERQEREQLTKKTPA